MKALVGAFNQEKTLVGAFSVIVQPVVEPMEHYTALISIVLTRECGGRQSVVWEIERRRGCEILIQTLNEYSFIGFIVFLVIYDVLMGPVLSSSALFCSSQYASFLQVLTSDKPMYLI